MDHMEDEKNVQQIKDDFDKKIGGKWSIEIKDLEEAIDKFGKMVDGMFDFMSKNFDIDPMEQDRE